LIDACVALDLEFLDSTEHGREIIEIGAIRFEADREIESYATLVRTKARVSHRLTRLTGLTQDHLTDALPLQEALAELSNLLDVTPIVGQSISIDVEQLRRVGLNLSAPLFDTFELGSLLLPGLPSYDLESIARALGLEPGPVRHRALTDARLAQRVFNALCARIGDLDLDTLRQVNRLALPLDWPPRALFTAAEQARERAQTNASPALPDLPGWLRWQAGGKARVDPITRGSPVPPRPLDVERVAAQLRTSGAVARVIDGFEERPEQIVMARAVAETLNAGGELLAEAGTGVGKSLAYLLPAVELAVDNGRRVVVATSTINLQDQLAQRELPTVQAVLNRPVRFSVLKGRSNYLCLRRWLALLQSEQLSADERRLLIKTLIWLPQTTTGDRAELRLFGREEEAWERINAVTEACTPGRCAFHRRGTCFLARARRAAEGSHVVVINHALLVATAGRPRGSVLPAFDYLIVDEAHHLEDQATAQLGWQLGTSELTTSLARLLPDALAGAAGLLRQAGGSLQRSGQPLDRLVADLEQEAVELGAALQQLFQRLRRFTGDHGQRAENRSTTVRLTTAARTQPAWSEIEIAWDDQRERMAIFRRDLTALVRALEAGPDQDSDECEALTGELAAQVDLWEQVAERLDAVLLEGPSETVAWIAARRGEDLIVNAAPLHVGSTLGALLSAPVATVLTSATLTAANSFDYLRERLGLGEPRELVVGSPFDYANAALIYLPVDLPEPTVPGYQSSVERVTGQLIAALDGRTLVLFTAYSQLRATYQALKDPLEARQIELLGQRMDGVSRARLLERFRGADRVALMGTTSFWEGVDVVGEALSCLVIARLPFNAPNDPVLEARAEQFDDPFNQYTVPQAILRFRQGFGRLIRSKSDRGVLVVLDRRLRTRAYGQAFLNSLSGCTVQEGPGSRAGAAARDWLAVSPSSGQSGGKPAIA
jgi:predicted DnaQ family exonuclease/DinG family helicase